MSAERLRQIMEAEEIRVIDIASEVHMSPTTVAKYLNGRPMNKTLRDRLDRYVAEKDAGAQSGGRKAAAG